jgi:CO/xanthine dehydrogenase Mo-binding subunit
VLLLTDATGPGPFGAKSVGELSNPGVGAAVANAVHAASGARVFSLPITSEKIYSALHTENRAGPPTGPRKEVVRE